MYEYIYSVTSDNLNSSSFIRPSQPYTSEINRKSSEDGSFLYNQDEVYFISDMRAFEKKLP